MNWFVVFATLMPEKFLEIHIVSLPNLLDAIGEIRVAGNIVLC